MRNYLVIFFCLLVSTTIAQSVNVPQRDEFGGIKIRYTEALRKDLQEEVNTLLRSPKHVEIMAQRAKTYFPIIERIFKEEGIPEEFKYLSLQESALIADAVSSSDAVGYWQFKDFTAAEMGLRIDRSIDERMNIVSASRAAAGYLIKNNSFFDNWLYALQAYQMGAGGAMRVLDDKYLHAKSMTLDRKTYWYVKKFLAHKIAYEGLLKGKANTELVEYYEGDGKSLKDIAKDVDISEEELLAYNRWLKRGKVPEDKPYAVLLPYTDEKPKVSSSRPLIAGNKFNTPSVATAPSASIQYRFDQPDAFPRIKIKDEEKGLVTANRIPAILAREGDSAKTLADRGEIDLSRFLKYNDIEIDDKIIPGQVYYLKRKKAKALVHNHVLQKGESLWEVSQKFGVRLRKLLHKNRFDELSTSAKPGLILWLRFVRPSNVEPEYRELKKSPVLVQENNDRPEETDASERVEQGDAVKETPIAATEEVEVSQSEQNTAGQDAQQSPDSPKQQQPLEINTVAKDSVARIHEVKAGETVYAIAKKYSVNVMDVLRWNDLKISDKISIDQKLKIWETVQESKEQPDIKTGDPYIYYTIEAGDTLFKIAKEHDMTIQELMDLNELSDNTLNFGDKLKVGMKSFND